MLDHVRYLELEVTGRIIYNTVNFEPLRQKTFSAGYWRVMGKQWRVEIST